jgi:hypothetical protein
MSAIKVLQIVIYLLGCFAVQGQVRNLWSASVYAPDPPYTLPSSYMATAASIDQKGNTIVGGTVGDIDFQNYGYGGDDVFVVKCNAKGNFLWRYELGVEAFGNSSGVEALVTDTIGNIYFTARTYGVGGYKFLLIKLNPHGDEIWRFQEYCTLSPEPPHASSCGLVVDSHDNVIVLELGRLAGVASTGQLWVTKFNPSGKQLWRTFMPGDGYATVSGPISKNITLLPDDSIVVAGIRNYAGWLFRLDEHGRIIWSEAPLGVVLPPEDYLTDIECNKNGHICATGFSQVSTFNKNSHINRITDLDEWMLGIISSSADSFLIGTLTDDEGWTRIHSFHVNGREQWTSLSTNQDILGAIQDKNGGWITAGTRYSMVPSGCNLVFEGIKANGKKYFHQEISYKNPDLGWANKLYKEFDAMQLAPDGTIRIIVTEKVVDSVNMGTGGNTGIGVFAFKFH